MEATFPFQKGRNYRRSCDNLPYFWSKQKPAEKNKNQTKEIRNTELNNARSTRKPG